MTEEEKDLVFSFFQAFGINRSDISFTTTPTHLEISLHLPQEKRGMFIGYKANTLDSFQLLLSLMLNNRKADEDKLKIVLDINDYRKQRLTQLLEKAKHFAQLAVQSGIPQPLFHLSPTERRQIHLYFKDDPNLTTYSEGEGTARTLYIASVK